MAAIYKAAGQSHAQSDRPCEDCVVVLGEDRSSPLYAILDGHGEGAVEVIQVVQQTLESSYDAFSKHEKTLVEVIENCQKALDVLPQAQEGGCTITLLTVDQQQKSGTIAYLGDCSAAILTVSKTDPWGIVLLTPPHRLTDESERLRVQQINNSTLDEQYVVHPADVELEWPRVLAVTRTLGDLSFGADSGISREPQHVQFALPTNPVSSYLLLASDGLWDMWPSPQAFALSWGKTASFFPLDTLLKPTKLLQSLLDFIDMQGGHEDDLAVILIPLQNEI